MDNLPRKRLFETDEADPRRLAGAKLTLPDLKRYFRIVHSNGGWAENQKDEQTDEGFRFDGGSLSAYAEKVLSRKLGRIYFPMAFNGVVAKALSEAGHPLLASDLSGYWVGRLKSIGLDVEVRGFEEMPKSGFDAVVSFEPCPVSCNMVGYVGLLRALASGVPFIGIDSYYHLGIPKVKERAEGEIRPVPLMMREGRRKDMPYHPRNPMEMNRLAYDYGVEYGAHDIYHDRVRGFDFECFNATPAAIRRMSLDLAVLERQEEWAYGEASVRGLARLMSVTREELAASLLRLKEISARCHIDDGHLFYSGIRLDAAKKDPGCLRTVKLVE